MLHSFFLPNMRMKQDVVPGMDQYMWFKADRRRQLRHRLRRAVRLGPLQDEGRATFEPRSEYDAWLEEKCAEQEHACASPQATPE